MLNKVPKDFTFFVKAHRELIHVRKKAQETLPRFHEMLKAYQRKQKLAGGAFQFPANSNATVERRTICAGSPSLGEYSYRDRISAFAVADGSIMDLPHNSAVQLSSPRGCD